MVSKGDSDTHLTVCSSPASSTQGEVRRKTRVTRSRAKEWDAEQGEAAGRAGHLLRGLLTSRHGMQLDASMGGKFTWVCYVNTNETTELVWRRATRDKIGIPKQAQSREREGKGKEERQNTNEGGQGAIENLGYVSKEGGVADAARREDDVGGDERARRVKRGKLLTRPDAGAGLSWLREGSTGPGH
ncbi:hypothetical protein POSPLADRAFT_1152925 [Postia placenta MAD-698-R-SB12]|uniref:Uncharacterized protein n=1 Tax=Postia placenta MAD-698-R-SB12 TaxID=670580 RepID=A0A1X6MR86_9APHY|nr:hypothetical protein POSPLADRAFT_1152925 [Postia placenta MAD-698-R-SB12]OSX58673.1 hypothetical protein POSPLADRAFT_1152925 [Postia placenta MAD-698-R-SB12]